MGRSGKEGGGERQEMKLHWIGEKKERKWDQNRKRKKKAGGGTEVMWAAERRRRRSNVKWRREASDTLDKRLEKGGEFSFQFRLFGVPVRSTHTHTTLTNAPAGWSRSISSNSGCARLGPTSWTRNAFLLCGELHICVYVTECMKECMNACVFQDCWLRSTYHKSRNLVRGLWLDSLLFDVGGAFF